MIVGLVTCLALIARVGPDADFIGTWELTSLSLSGRPRAGRGLLVVAPRPPGQPAEWTWDLAHQPKGDLETTRKPGRPWPIIGRHTPAPLVGSYMDLGGDGIYRLTGDTLTVVISTRSDPIRPDEDPFRPGFGRTIETYRRVRRDPDPSYRPAVFPKGPARLIATWDEAWHGVLQGPPRGVLNHFAAYDLGDGVRVIRRRGPESLDDPPPPDLDPKDLPTGTLIHPPGQFDDRTYDVAYPAPGPEARAIIDAFRARDPDVPDRRRAFPGLLPNLMVPGQRFLGWDGILLSVRTDRDRTIAEVVIRPRMLGMSSYGTRTLQNYWPPVLETWELRGGELHYLGGGPELLERDEIASLILPPPEPAPGGPGGLSIRPRPAHLPPIPRIEILSTHIHYRPARIDLEDSTRNDTEAGAPNSSSPEFTIHHAFSRMSLLLPPAREAFFAELLMNPGYHQSHWDAVIKSAVAEGDDIRAEIFVWPSISVLQGRRFRTIPARPFLETWLYRDGRLIFVSGRPASPKNGVGREPPRIEPRLRG